MRRLILFLALVLNSITCVVAQQAHFGWAKKVGGTDEERGNSVTLDKDGNILVTGSFRNSVDFDPNAGNYLKSSAGMDDIFIEKLDAEGNLIWVKTIGGTGDDRGWSTKTDASGNVYVTGTFTGQVDFDPGSGVFPLAGQQPVDNFIVKLNSSGDFLWASKYGDTSGNALAIDNAGNSISAGYSLRKISPAGDLLWTFRPTGGIVEVLELRTDYLGNIYATGRFSGTVDFDPSAAESILKSTARNGFQMFSDNDIFVAKYDNSGNLLWAKQMGGANRDAGYGLAVDSSMNVYITGIYYATGDFDPGPNIYSLTNKGESDFFILKLNATGDFGWAWGIGSASFETAEGIEVDANGNVYLTGSFSESLELGSELTITRSGGPYQFITTLDDSGNFLWAKGTSGGVYTTGSSIALNSIGNVYTVGIFYGTTQFDFENGTGQLSSSGGGDVFISELKVTGMPVKPTNTAPHIESYIGTATVNQGNSFDLDLADFNINDPDNDDLTLTILPGENYTVSGTTVTPVPGFSGELTITVKVSDGKEDSETFQFTVRINEIITSVEEEATNKFEIYPNPSSGLFFFKSSSLLKEVTIISTSGEIIQHKRISSDQLDISGFPTGIYFLEILTINGALSLQRLIIY